MIKSSLEFTSVDFPIVYVTKECRIGDLIDFMNWFPSDAMALVDAKDSSFIRAFRPEQVNFYKDNFIVFNSEKYGCFEIYENIIRDKRFKELIVNIEI